ncbi:MAG TPA: hypothetical protein VF723_13715 [Pyrinomonadaceae bacterium]|jgi:hypothetical protein
MISLKRIPLLFALILTCTGIGSAQKFCEAAPPSPFKHSALIVTSYDPVVRRMKTTLEHPRAISKQDGGLYLYASFFYQDRRVRQPPSIDLYFIAVSKRPHYREAHELSILADGQSWPFTGLAQYATEPGEKGLTLEKIKVTLSYPSFVNLLRARKVQARLGGSEFELTNNHLESLREIASLMMPSGNSKLAMR